MSILSEEQAQEIFKSEHCNISKDLAGILYRAIEAAVLEAQGKQEPVAWVRRHPDGALTAEFLEDAVIEPVRKKSGAWVPLYLHPQPIAQEPVTVEALREIETAWIADALGASISNIGYPVGCGVAPNRESLMICAGKLFDRFAALASAISQPDKKSEPIKWECFEDTSYYNMWAVRPVGEKQWGKFFHVVNGAEAESLCAVLNRQPDQSAEVSEYEQVATNFMYANERA